MSNDINVCKICYSKVNHCFDALILKKYNIAYYKCTNCGFIQTERPFWLNEAYASAINTQDIGLMYRNMAIAPVLSSLIKFFFNRKGKFLDYGGGYGMLTRIMRDKGYNYYRYDTYCENIFAKRFDLSSSGAALEYELLTAFEVFEHLVDPISEVESMLKWSKNIFFSTELQPTEVSSPEDWWYVMPETGQHIAFYTIKSLRLLGEKYGLNFYTNGFNLHLFTKMKINSFAFKFILNYRLAKLSDMFLKNKSLLMKDFNEIK
jgi:hypothetical protein